MGGLKFYDTGSTLIDRKDAPVPDFTNGKERVKQLSPKLMLIDNSSLF